MVFDNLYEETDKSNRSRWVIAGSVLLALILFVLLLQASCTNLTQEEVEVLISKSERLKNIDRICNDILEQQNFQFYGKFLGSNVRRTAQISHRFKTDKPYEEVKKSFYNWFKTNGWLLSDAREYDGRWHAYFQFRKANITVAVEHIGVYEYDTSCSD